MTRLRTFLLLVLISVIVTASIQLSERITEQALPTDISQIKDDVDYSIEDFKLSLIDSQGKMQYHLSAASMLHYKQSDQTQLQEPSLELQRTAEEQWKIEARKGQVSPRGKDLSLQGMVRIERTATETLEPFTMTTESLQISTSKNTVSTEDSVHLEGSGISIRAKGMFADLDQDKIQLLANVRVSYVPQR
jgi:lipopolysaccharide export system protein LptC